MSNSHGSHAEKKIKHYHDVRKDRSDRRRWKQELSKATENFSFRYAPSASRSRNMPVNHFAG